MWPFKSKSQVSMDAIVAAATATTAVKTTPVPVLPKVNVADPVGPIFTTMAGASAPEVMNIKTISDLPPEIQDKVNEVIHDLQKKAMDDHIAEYLKSTGKFIVTPSGTPAEGIISKAGTAVKDGAIAVKDTAVDGGHIVRGIHRKITNSISNKLNELKTLGS
jgi:hypothetical protein